MPIFADAERITEIFNAYLANALKDSPMESPVTVQVAVANAEATVLVHHERPAIPQDVQELLWERFTHARESAVQQEQNLSFGSGFSLCRALIEAHHGRVGVESDPGHGETFWFTLPLATSPRGSGSLEDDLTDQETPQSSCSDQGSHSHASQDHPLCIPHYQNQKGEADYRLG